MVRFRDALNLSLLDQGMNLWNVVAVQTLVLLLVIVVFLTFLCVFVPLWWRAPRGTLRGSGTLMLFFAGIGFGFMMIEIALMQRLITFLGHPIYGLSVVLFSILLSSGLGSDSTRKLRLEDGALERRMFLLLGCVVLVGLATPWILRSLEHTALTWHILAAVILLFPLGYTLGMAFPLGMKVAGSRSEELMPWLWGINGATSVCASVIAVAVGLGAGISTTFWAGAGCYGLATLGLMAAAGKARRALR